MERELLAVKTREHLSFAEARAKVSHMFPDPLKTYATAATKNKTPRQLQYQPPDDDLNNNMKTTQIGEQTQSQKRPHARSESPTPINSLDSNPTAPEKRIKYTENQEKQQSIRLQRQNETVEQLMQDIHDENLSHREKDDPPMSPTIRTPPDHPPIETQEEKPTNQMKRSSLPLENKILNSARKGKSNQRSKSLTNKHK